MEADSEDVSEEESTVVIKEEVWSEPWDIPYEETSCEDPLGSANPDPGVSDALSVVKTEDELLIEGSYFCDVSAQQVLVNEKKWAVKRKHDSEEEEEEEGEGVELDYVLSEDESDKDDVDLTSSSSEDEQDELGRMFIVPCGPSQQVPSSDGLPSISCPTPPAESAPHLPPDAGLTLPKSDNSTPNTFAGQEETTALTKPIEYFRLLFTEEILEFLVICINSYGEEELKDVFTQLTRIRLWKPITVDVLEKFLGLLFLMGHSQLPSISRYFKTAWPYRYPVFSKTLKAGSFQLILRTLYFSQISSQTEPNPMARIKPFLDLFHQTMERIYPSSKKLCLNEPMMLWRGRLYTCHRITRKLYKFPMKVHMLTQTDGLVLKLLVYAGPEDKLYRSLRHPTTVVQHLIDDYLGEGHVIYTDDFNELPSKDTYKNGSAKKRRLDLRKVSGAKHKSRKSRLVDNRGVVLKWYDKKDVIVLSSEFGPDMKNAEDRKNYHQYKDGISGIEEMKLMSFCPFEKKTFLWFQKLGIHIFHIMMYNSYLLFRKQTKSKMTLLEFREAVIINLIGEEREPAPDFHIHLPMTLPIGKDKKCIQCETVLRFKKRTITYCPDCPKAPGLCLTPCFRDYHEYK